MVLKYHISNFEYIPFQAKNFIKVFCAHLFSHVGLTALIVIYSILGAFIFTHLEV